MSIAQIRIVDNEFVSYDGEDLEYFDSKCVIGNGWKCQLEENGSLECKASQKFGNKLHTMSYNICPNGFSSLIYRVNGKKPKIIREAFVVKKGRKFSSGLLILPGEDIERRYPYFLDEEIM